MGPADIATGWPRSTFEALREDWTRSALPPLQHGPRAPTEPRARSLLRIPYFLNSIVERGAVDSAAARGLRIRSPLAASSACRIRLRSNASTCSRNDGPPAACGSTASAPSPPSPCSGSACSASSRTTFDVASATQRAIPRFSSWRTLPGQGSRSGVRSTSGSSRRRGCSPSCCAALRAKCAPAAGCRSRRSRSGGTSIGTTLRR